MAATKFYTNLNTFIADNNSFHNLQFSFIERISMLFFIVNSLFAITYFLQVSIYKCKRISNIFN